MNNRLRLYVSKINKTKLFLQFQFHNSDKFGCDLLIPSYHHPVGVTFRLSVALYPNHPPA